MKLRELYEFIDKDVQLRVYTLRDKTIYECAVGDCVNADKNEREVVDIRPLSNSRENYLEIYVR